MIKITMKQGDTVAIIEHGEIKKGILKDVKVLDPPVAIVDFDGEIRKVLVEDLAKVQENTEDEIEEIREDKEPVEKSEITITSDEFKKIATDVADREVEKIGKGGGSFYIIFTIFVLKLHRALFFDAVENE